MDRTGNGDARRRPARWPLLLALALSAVALLTLFWLQQRLVADERIQLANAVRVFERADLLLRPEDEQVNFALIESNARSFEESELIARMLVSKRMADGRELLVYPFHHELLHPDWRSEVEDWQRLAVGGTENPSGFLYVHLTPANRQAVNRIMLLFGGFLLLCLGVLVFRQRGKEIELHRTASELEKRKLEVIRLERFALAGQLSANIMHDIKKPVFNIKHEVADLLEGNEALDEIRSSLESIREQTELFSHILRDIGLEQFVRAAAAEREYCDIAEALQRSVALVQYERGGIDVRFELPPDGSLPLVLAPPHWLVQLFSNLVLNAYQAMGDSGTLTLAARVVEKPTQAVEVVVRDTGPGVAEELRARVLEPFVTTKGEAEGSGLGLYISSTIAQELGGELELAQTGPEGTTFRVVLPAAE